MIAKDEAVLTSLQIFCMIAVRPVGPIFGEHRGAGKLTGLEALSDHPND